MIKNVKVIVSKSDFESKTKERFIQLIESYDESKENKPMMLYVVTKILDMLQEDYSQEGKASETGTCEYTCKADGSCRVNEKIQGESESATLCGAHDQGGKCNKEPKTCKTCRDICDEQAPKQNKEFILQIKGNAGGNNQKASEGRSGEDARMNFIEISKLKTYCL